MKKLTFPAVLVLASATAACGSGTPGAADSNGGPTMTSAQAGNPLLGTWTSDQNNGCAEKIVFTATASNAHYGAIGPHAAYDSVESVTYVGDGPNKETVVGQGTGAGGEIWVLVDATHARTGSADQCEYTKTG